jgi:hypothetical protein
MADSARLAYLQARLQARHGDRPSPDDWRVAESSTDLSHYLDAIRRTSLRRWVADINHEMEPEVIERQLRIAWRGAVGEIASWSPAEWREAVEWLRWLPDLPAIGHLLRGGKAPPWMRADPVMRELAFDEPQRRREAFVDSPLAPLFHEHEPAEVHVIDAWLAEWRRRLPDPGRGREEELEAAIEIVQRHIEAMRSDDGPDGRALRNAFAARISRRFRRGAGSVSALISHLILDGLELERVRAGVVTRRLMPDRVEGRSWA